VRGALSRPSPRPRRADEAVAAGCGAAYVRYDGAGAHVTTVAEVEVDRASGAVVTAGGMPPLHAGKYGASGSCPGGTATR
jgi:hypothetical protein